VIKTSLKRKIMTKIESKLTKCLLAAAVIGSVGCCSTYGMKGNAAECGKGKSVFINELSENVATEKWQSCQETLKKVGVKLDARLEEGVKMSTPLSCIADLPFDDIVIHLASADTTEGFSQVVEEVRNAVLGHSPKFPEDITMKQLELIFGEKSFFMKEFGKDFTELRFVGCKNIQNLGFLHSDSLPNLKILSVTETGIESISGIENFKKLTHFAAVNCPKLKDTSPLSKCKLKMVFTDEKMKVKSKESVEKKVIPNPMNFGFGLGYMISPPQLGQSIPPGNMSREEILKSLKAPEFELIQALEKQLKK
jgi:hypothetical protein